MHTTYNPVLGNPGSLYDPRFPSSYGTYPADQNSRYNDLLSKPVPAQQHSNKPYLCGYCSFQSLDMTFMQYHIDHAHSQSGVTSKGPRNSLINDVFEWCLKSPEENVPSAPQNLAGAAPTGNTPAKDAQFECRYCNYRSGCKTTTRKHEILHVLNNRYPCRHCVFTAPTLPTLTRHALFAHQDKMKEPLNPHAKYAPRRPPAEVVRGVQNLYKCGFCKFSGPSAKSLELHLRRDHVQQANNRQCHLCRLAFSTHADFWKHVTSRHHHPPTPVQCSEHAQCSSHANPYMPCAVCSGGNGWDEEPFFKHLLGW